jgi:DNA adenine methylase
MSGTYCEPFLGGGAMFFGREGSQAALLADTNELLIQTFQVVRDSPDDLVAALSEMRVSEADYTRARFSQPVNPVAAAARFLYLNRTAFNGLYRVNADGAFNVPFGRRHGTNLCQREILADCSARLRPAHLRAQDFRSTLAAIGEGDTAYIDPPYTTRHATNGFRRYNERLFTWLDQLELAEVSTRAAAAGTHIIVSNAPHQDVIALYPKDLFLARKIRRDSRVAADARHRGAVWELLIWSRSLGLDHRAVGRRLRSVQLESVPIALPRKRS